LEPSVYFIDHLPIQVQPVDFTLIIIASIVVATVATLYPARRAADLTPVEAIRHE
jgi:lipoprotein-releasing system permease protein